jgi:hypothetical protein
MFSFHHHTRITTPTSHSHHRVVSHNSIAPLARRHHHSATHSPHVAIHHFLLTHLSPTHIVEAAVDVGAAAPPLT